MVMCMLNLQQFADGLQSKLRSPSIIYACRVCVEIFEGIKSKIDDFVYGLCKVINFTLD